MDYAVQNEKGVSIGESTCTAKTVGWPADQQHGYNLVGIEDLSKIAMERCDTARCAMQTMGDIAVAQGFYSADSGLARVPNYLGSSECLVVGDATPGEIWIFNIMTGKGNASAIWAAQRALSDHVVAIANTFTIRKMDFNDSDNFLHSPGVTELAEEMGWWNPAEEEFDFFRAYGYIPKENPNFIAYYSARRMWRVLSLMSPDEGAKLDRYKPNLPTTQDPLPNSVRAPRGTVTLEMLQNVMRDHYEGTEFDLTQGMAAGPYGNPNRGGALALGIAGQWERAISMHRTSWSFILEGRSGGKSITWFGLDSPHGTAYLPFYAAANASAPASYCGSHHMAKFSTDAAWWAFNLVNQYQDLNFALINKEVREKSRAIEAEAVVRIAEWEKEADQASSSSSSFLEVLTARSNAFAEEKVAEWWAFAWTLIAKYRGYVITHNETMTGEEARGQPYPSWWLESPEVGFATWTDKGPFHGVLLSAKATHRLASTSDSELSSVLVTIGLIAFPVCMGVVGVTAHQAGVRKGRNEPSKDSHYMLVA
jgi:dipeptidase